MTTLPPDQPKRNPYQCRKCGQQIFWHKAASGKHYPCDSATNRRAFHQCVGPTEQPKPKPTPKPQPAQTLKPITPAYFEATVEERVAHLEEQVKNLVRTVKTIEDRQPITDADLPEGF